MDDKLRRLELRDFLIAARSRLGPADVGLPATERRRVPGLRREEVSELAGVTPVWYRWFESGREIRVSENFLERISNALRLDAHDQVTLYRLALPALYRADLALRSAASERTNENGESPGRAASPVFGDGDIDDAADAFARERQLFLSDRHSAVPRTRSRIVRSWVRSRALNVDARRAVATLAAHRGSELDERRGCNERLLRASSGVVKDLADRFNSTGYAVVVTDERGCLLHLDGELHVRRRLSNLNFEPGGDWSESSAGTNAIGTALADGRPLQLMGAEHYCDGWHGFTCTAAPIRAPDGSLAGVLDITGDYRLVRRHLVAQIIESALEIEECLDAL